MSVAERDAFLADVHVGVLSMDEPGRGPMSVPIWYEYEDGKILMGILGTSLKGDSSRAAGRATLVAQTERLPIAM
jgi:nitroimidazol reductase NimA-like FMN-containing flavoprotein (pyridoxamine 5'-phosphate oxidase superfamily)